MRQDEMGSRVGGWVFLRDGIGFVWGGGEGGYGGMAKGWDGMGGAVWCFEISHVKAR